MGPEEPQAFIMQIASLPLGMEKAHSGRLPLVRLVLIENSRLVD